MVLKLSQTVVARVGQEVVVTLEGSEVQALSLHMLSTGAHRVDRTARVAQAKVGMVARPVVSCLKEVVRAETRYQTTQRAMTVLHQEVQAVEGRRVRMVTLVAAMGRRVPSSCQPVLGQRVVRTSMSTCFTF